MEEMIEEEERPAVFQGPSEKVSVILSDEEYIKFVILRERIVFEKRMTQKEKNAEIVKMSLSMLENRVGEIVRSGHSFVDRSKI